MYQAFYGLHERPFDLTPNPRFLFMTPGHREALSTIQYGMSGRKGLTLVVGPAGTGKTTLVHAAIEGQQGQKTRALYLTNPVISRDEFFQFLADELGLSMPAERSKPRFLHELRAHLLARHAKGELTALIVDEAQAMPDDLLEEVRLLENLETTSEKLLPVVLVGQSELADRLKQPALVPIKQRIALRSTLAPLSARETATYVAERLRIAGGDIDTIFTQEAVAAICGSCGGIPRTISVVCDNALVSGFALDQHLVGASIISEVCRDFDLPVARVAGSTRGSASAGVAPTRQGPQAQTALTVVPAPADAPAPILVQAFPMSNFRMTPAPVSNALAVDPPTEGPSPHRHSRPDPLRTLSRGAIAAPRVLMKGLRSLRAAPRLLVTGLRWSVRTPRLLVTGLRWLVTAMRSLIMRTASLITRTASR